MAKIKIELDSDASGAQNDLGSVDDFLRKIGQSSQKLAEESAKGAKQASSGYASLRAELQSNKKALEQLEVGSEAFADQAKVVGELEERVNGAKTAIREAIKAGKEFDDVVMLEPEVNTEPAANSIRSLTRQLNKANEAFETLEVGTEEYDEAAASVADLEEQLAQAKTAADELTTGKVGDLTASIGRTRREVKRLEGQLTEARAEQAKFAKGSKEYEDAAKKVDQLEKELSKASRELKTFTNQRRDVQRLASEVDELEKELSSATATLKELDRGSDAYNRQAAEVRKLRSRLGEARGETDKLTKGSSGIAGQFGAAATQAGAMGAAVAGVSTIVFTMLDRIKADAVEAERRQRQSFLATADLEEVLATLNGNFGDQSLDDVRARLDALSKETDQDQRLLADALATLNSRAGLATPEQQDFALAEATKITRDVEKGSDIAADALRASLADDGQATNAEIRENLGIATQVQGVIPGSDVGEFLRNIAPGVEALQTDRNELDAVSNEQARELGVFLSQASQDTSGAETGTALAKVAAVLGDLELDTSVETNDGQTLTTTQEAIQAVRDERDIDRKLELIRNDEAIAAQVAQQLGQEKGVSGLALLVQGSEAQAASLERMREAITGGNQAIQRVVELQQDANGLEGLKVRQQGEARAQRLQLANPEQDAGAVRDTVGSILENLDANNALESEEVDQLISFAANQGADPYSAGLFALSTVDQSSLTDKQNDEVAKAAREIIELARANGQQVTREEVQGIQVAANNSQLVANAVVTESINAVGGGLASDAVDYFSGLTGVDIRPGQTLEEISENRQRIVNGTLADEIFDQPAPRQRIAIDDAPFGALADAFAANGVEAGDLPGAQDLKRADADERAERRHQEQIQAQQEQIQAQREQTQQLAGAFNNLANALSGVQQTAPPPTVNPVPAANVP